MGRVRTSVLGAADAARQNGFGVARRAVQQVAAGGTEDEAADRRHEWEQVLKICFGKENYMQR